MKYIKNYLLNSYEKDQLFETKGEHDVSELYDMLYANVEKHLSRWGAGPVYGWKGEKGICFPVSKGKNVKKDDWITIFYNGSRQSFADDFLITLSPYGTDDPEEARAYKDMVYNGQEADAIDELLGI